MQVAGCPRCVEVVVSFLSKRSLACRSILDKGLMLTWQKATLERQTLPVTLLVACKRCRPSLGPLGDRGSSTQPFVVRDIHSFAATRFNQAVTELILRDPALDAMQTIGPNRGQGSPVYEALGESKKGRHYREEIPKHIAAEVADILGVRLNSGTISDTAIRWTANTLSRLRLIALSTAGKQTASYGMMFGPNQIPRQYQDAVFGRAGSVLSRHRVYVRQPAWHGASRVWWGCCTSHERASRRRGKTTYDPVQWSYVFPILRSKTLLYHGRTGPLTDRQSGSRPRSRGRGLFADDNEHHRW